MRMSVHFSAILLFLFVGCANAPPSPADIETTLQANARTILREANFVLYSPYDEAPTRDYADVVREESSLTKELFADTDATPVRIYLVSVDDESKVEREPWEHAASGGFEGGAFATGFAFIFVSARAAAGSMFVQAAYSSQNLRHELAHLYARRAGLVRATWFHEGLAREVEHMRTEGAELRAHPFPPTLIDARRTAGVGSVAELLRWTRDSAPLAADRTRLYNHAQALFRFLRARAEDRAVGSRFHEQSRAVLALDDSSILALEAEWLRWLASLDALAAIRAGVWSATRDERAEFASLLPRLAERGAAELATPAADELALVLLGDAACEQEAASFLVFFRSAALTEADVARLCEAREPARALTGFALRARRKEPFDLERARAIWDAVPESDRDRYAMQSAMIPKLKDPK
ncbi:MAG: hypothetical protein ACKVX7_15425 [Planctomycetota bacterium]